MQIQSTKFTRPDPNAQTGMPAVDEWLETEFYKPEGADFLPQESYESADEQGANTNGRLDAELANSEAPQVGNFALKNVIFGMGMGAIASGVKGAIKERTTPRPECKTSVLKSMHNLLKPRLEFRPIEGTDKNEFVNTCGDIVDPDTTIIIPKKQAIEGQDDEGNDFVKVTHHDQDYWVPKENFQESPGKSGVYYLPTYKSSPKAAAFGGTVKALLALGAPAALSVGTAGFAAHKFGKNAPMKNLIGAATGAVILGAAHTALTGGAGLPAVLLYGASAGLVGVHSGEGSAKIRDAAYGGGIAGLATASVTGTPLSAVSSAAAAGLASRAESPLTQGLLAGATGAALGAAQAALSGQPIALVAGLTAATSVAGVLAGPTMMQGSRNLSHLGGKGVAKLLKHAPDPVIRVVGTVPFVAGMGFLGAAAGLIIPGAGAIGAAVGTIGGAAMGYTKTSKSLEEAQQKQEVSGGT